MTAREMPAAAAAREISTMKALNSPPHCTADADLANNTKKKRPASRRLIMPKLNVQMADLVLTHKELQYKFDDLEPECAGRLISHPFDRVPILRSAKCHDQT